ncbi:DUF445 domain-containing protein [Nocardia macrotermitis]|uniref:DUF445 domain-containing protein n=1 Tax=Nocardia macrotermitis TaxID=2585198 RepID=A0A7K0D4N2_9NOCA|nr:DUF445 family protein [Nocardia macrotermitis]MQY20292.1 hypothetical protein [Nocardia macrotermitis]
MIDDFLQHWMLYCSIPLVAALIGWTTKLVAVEMLFRPLEFIGIRPWFGWQGVVPRAAPRMATVAVDLMFTRLIDPKELLSRIDVGQLTTTLREPMNEAIAHLVHELMMRYEPRIWVTVPEFARATMIARVQRDVPALIDDIANDLRDNLEHVMDLRAVAVDTLVNDKALLVKLVRDIATNELRFIVRSGLLFGTVLGFVQMLTWAFTHSPMLMPLFGGLTGLSTDWLALQMIFRPINRRRILGIVPWQGLFHKRREEVCNDYATLIATEILTPARMLEAVLDGERADRLTAILSRRMSEFIDTQSAPVQPLVTLVAGDAIATLKREMVPEMLAYIRTAAAGFEEQAMQTLDLRNLVVEKTRNLTDEEYEGLLRPAFKQDEWKLVAIGGILGFLVGELQVHLLLS